MLAAAHVIYILFKYMKKTFAKSYDYNVLCMICREKIKASTAVIRWDGLVVGRDHSGCFEYRSPLDMPAPPLRDQRPLPFTSPEPADTFTPVGTSTTVSVTASPFSYTTGSNPEQLTFGGTGKLTRFTVNGADIIPPVDPAGKSGILQFGPNTNLVITYTGTITLSSMPIVSYQDSKAALG